MHGPKHLFCAGCDMDDDPLARAAWAGHLAANGERIEAEKWAASARAALGRVICSFGSFSVRVTGDGPTVEDIDHLIAVLNIQRDGYETRAARKAREIQTTPSTDPASPTDSAEAKS